MDPTQQAMMKFMPLIASAFMLFLPAGLNLYIFVSTAWGIVQQGWVQGAFPFARSQALIKKG